MAMVDDSQMACAVRYLSMWLGQDIDPRKHAFHGNPGQKCATCWNHESDHHGWLWRLFHPCRK